MTRVFLHVGAPKTGTTFLQDVLWSNREALRRQGVLYPGDVPAAHFHAAQDLRGRYFRGHKDPRVDGAWERVASAARGWSGPTVLLSHEVLAGCDPDEARKAVESLHPHEVHVVYTARDLARQIPAMWQESVKNGRVVPYGQYLQTLQSDDPHLVGRIFWRTQDAVDVLTRWGAAVRPEHIHVVTVPPRGARADLLWRRFCEVTGLDASRLDDTVRSRGNVSVGLAEGELLRRLNEKLKGELSWPEHEAVLKNFLTGHVLTGRPGSTPTGIPAADRDWVLQRSRELADGLRERGYDVAGSLDDLVPDLTGAADAPPDAAADEVLDAAVDALAVLLVEHVAPKQTRRARLRRWGSLVSARLPGRLAIRR